MSTFAPLTFLSRFESMQTFCTKTTRIAWIDWMKAIGMYFIVLGHFFSIGHKYIYAFSVPLFFLISGFLSRKEKDNRVFWKKLLYNLIIPMVIISTMIFLYSCVVSFRNGTFEIMRIVRFLQLLIFGYHNAVCGCWFVYTLCLMKIVYQYCPWKSVFYAIGVGCLLGAYVYNHVDLSHSLNLFREANSIVDVCTALPFFAIGVFVGNYKEYLNNMSNYMVLGMAFVCSLAFVYLSANHNGYVWMYHCGYGGRMLWFLIGGIAGSACIFVVSKVLGRTPWIVQQISKGTILILGFHFYTIAFFRSFYQNPYFDFLSALVIVLLFIPVILLAEKLFPLILGKYRLKKQG